MKKAMDGWLDGVLMLVAAWLLAWGYCAATPEQMSAESDFAEAIELLQAQGTSLGVWPLRSDQGTGAIHFTHTPPPGR